MTGLSEVPEIILNLPDIPGGKKLVYPHVDLPLMALADFEKQADEDAVYKKNCGHFESKPRGVVQRSRAGIICRKMDR